MINVQKSILFLDVCIKELENEFTKIILFITASKIIK